MAEEEQQDVENTKNHKPIFRELTAEDPEPETTVIDSLCMNCGETVSIRSSLFSIVSRHVAIMHIVPLGRNEIVTHQNTTLQRCRSHVVRLR